MKIADVRATTVTVPLEAPLRHANGCHWGRFVRTIIEIESDSGLVGLGEMGGGGESAIATVLALKPSLVGRDPARVEDMRFLLANPTASLYNNRTQVVAALEFACLDLIGQAWGVPVCDLLGGRVRDLVPFASYLFFRYADASGQGTVRTADQLLAHARALKKQYGFRTHKLKGGVFPLEYDLACYRALAAAFPGDSFRFDPNAVWTTEQAIRFGRAIEDLNNDYLEDPVFGLTGMRHARERLRVPLATNTVVVNFEQLAANVLDRAVDVILLDTTFWGGIRACVKAAGVCETFQLGVAVHSSGELGIQLATMLHLGAVVPNLSFAADAHYHHVADDIIEGGKLKYEQGAIRVPDGPGLGVRLDRKKLAQYADLYRELGNYAYDQDPARPGWAPLVPNDRWADPSDDREPFVRGCQKDRTVSNGQVLRTAEEARVQTRRIVSETPVFDMHTHLFPPAFGDLSRWGIDSLLTYHYLVAEVMRAADVRAIDFQRMPQPAQADLIWDALFVRSTPLSEATRGVVAVLSALGLDPARSDLRQAREFFRDTPPEQQVDVVLNRAHVSAVVMTNDPFDPNEAALWQKGRPADARFKAALRIDPLLNDWATARRALSAAGYGVGPDVDDRAMADARRFVDDWIARMDPFYLAVSLPDDFAWPEDSPRGRLIEHVVLPACRDHGLPFAMMIGVRRAVNPALRDAGDGLGHADVSTIHRLCRTHPDNRFLVTMLSRENQHELCVAARKFANLMPFGCWWFLNNPSIVSEITRERLELLGPTFIPQHSDARVLEQLLYKWPHARRDIANALADQYAGVVENGRPVTVAEMRRDVGRLFSENFLSWTGRSPAIAAAPAV